MIEARIYNQALELQGIIDEFSSLIWIRRYNEPGEFEIHAPYSSINKTLLVKENVIQRFNNLTDFEAGVIEYLDMTENEIVAKGRFLESYLDRRIIKETTYYTGTAENSMRRIVTEMVAIPRLSLGANHGLDVTLEFQVTYKNILRTMKKIAKATGLGFRIIPDFTLKTLTFDVYKGTDRTMSTSAPVIFSETFDNLSEEEYQYDSTSYKTKAFVTTGEGNDRIVYSTGSGSGLDLREMHVASSVDTSDLTTSEIEAAMIQEGQDALAKNTEFESFTFTTEDGTFAYREDYDVGDIVSVRHNAWGYINSFRITAIEEDYEEGGTSIVLTCGTTAPETVDFEEE